MKQFAPLKLGSFSYTDKELYELLSYSQRLPKFVLVRCFLAGLILPLLLTPSGGLFFLTILLLVLVSSRRLVALIQAPVVGLLRPDIKGPIEVEMGTEGIVVVRPKYTVTLKSETVREYFLGKDFLVFWNGVVGMTIPKRVVSEESWRKLVLFAKENLEQQRFKLPKLKALGCLVGGVICGVVLFMVVLALA